MGKVIFGINVSLDGCCDHTKGIPDEEVHEFFADLMRRGDVLAYGRKTYELMVPFWPDMAEDHSGETKAINDFAEAFDSVGEIVVFSKTLAPHEGGKTRIVSTSPQEEIGRLKREDKTILLGGVDIPGQLIAAGLVDEYIFVVQPIIVGAGRRLLDGINLPETLQLKLVETKVFKSGCVAVRYVKE